MKLTLKEKFLARVRQDHATGCWLWTGHIQDDGYGCASLSGKRYGAHRLAWELFRGRIPRQKLVCHKCDVRACVNPDHLFLGTQADNAADMRRKRRSPWGEKHFAAKLTAAQVQQIKALLKADRLYMTEIARQFGVSSSAISSIRGGRTWSHVAATASTSENMQPPSTNHTNSGGNDHG